MKKLLYGIVLLIACNICVNAQPRVASDAQDITYFLPKGNYVFNPQIPLPQAVLGYQVGQQHADWGDVLDYMRALDAASDRVSIKQFGRTNEFRPIIQVIITSKKNQQNLEAIRQDQLKLTEVNLSGNLDVRKMPIVANFMYSIHGNEPSGVNSAIVLAYYLAAAEGKEIEDMLDNMVIVLTPGQNPDGINRFATWVNTTRSFPDVSNLDSREFSEPWPSSRSNHYWANANRDWLMAEHPEGKNAIDMYFEWMPTVVADFHEQGGDRTYYFSPGHPKRTHPLTPQRNQDLTSKLTSYCADALDQIGTLYFSKEGYDDFYLGKGAAYGDIHGSVCILFEQLASRGQLRPTANYGEMSFASTVRNQAFSSIGLLKGSLDMKYELMEYQRNYFIDIKKEADKALVQAYVFNSRGSQAIAYHFLETMKQHRVDVYHLARKHTAKGVVYDPADSYVIPVNQKHTAMVKTIMENVTQYEDSTFYDISTWTFPHAYNLNYDALPVAAGFLGDKVERNVFVKGQVIGGKSAEAYAFENTQYYAPKMIVELLKSGLIVKVAGKPFTYPNEGRPIQFGYGTIIVQVQYQSMNSDAIFNKLTQLAAECGVNVYAVNQGLMLDHDLGAPSVRPIKLPKVAIVVGSGMGVPETGEVWMLLNQKFQWSPVLIDYSRLGAVNLNQYNVLIMAGGTPSRELSQSVTEKIKNWVSDGGTLIAIGDAFRWTNSAKLTSIKTKPLIRLDSSLNLTYDQRSGANAGSNIDGVILQCKLDKTHPLAWGYNQNELPMMKVGGLTFEATKSAYVPVLAYTDKPYLSGCISTKNLKRIANTPAVVTESNGRGQVIVFVDDPNFRSYWYGATKLFMNAIIFGQLL